MKRPNITPGYWDTCETSNSEVRVTTKGQRFVFRIGGIDLRRDEDKANARAIASVPALLAALEEMLDEARQAGIDTMPGDDFAGFNIACENAKAALIEAGYTFDPTSSTAQTSSGLCRYLMSLSPCIRLPVTLCH